MRLRIKGQNYIIEFVLLAFIGLLVFIGLFSFYRVALSPLYNANFEEHTSAIIKKIEYSYNTFKKYNIDKGLIKINIPKRINNEDYLIRSVSTDSLAFYLGEKYIVEYVPYKIYLNYTITSSQREINVYYEKGKDYIELW